MQQPGSSLLIVFFQDIVPIFTDAQKKKGAGERRVVYCLIISLAAFESGACESTL